MDICIKSLNKSKVYGVEFRLFRNIENQIHIYQGSHNELEKYIFRIPKIMEY